MSPEERLKKYVALATKATATKTAKVPLTKIKVKNKPSTSLEELHRIATNPKYHEHTEVALKIAQHPEVHSNTLNYLSEHPRSIVRKAVARHLNTDAVTLDNLSKDPRKLVRKSVVDNPNTHHHTLTDLSKDIDPSVKAAAKKQIACRKNSL